VWPLVPGSGLLKLDLFRGTLARGVENTDPGLGRGWPRRAGSNMPPRAITDADIQARALSALAQVLVSAGMYRRAAQMAASALVRGPCSCR
jgi:hypothetical protein